ncbi:RNA polymerase factor sigma-54 [Paenibacillus sp. HJGM_3]|uniref:RNA polymerase factor sigma-54 n=1 Tax=Paenibacillus sp. HJGM_3 TaxID=3379816 RepID=UPI003858A5D4
MPPHNARTPSLQQRLEQQQQMKLTLTPAVKQSLELLRMSASELAGYILDTAWDNPALELRSPPSAGTHSPGSASSRPIEFTSGSIPSDDSALEQSLLEQLRLTDCSPAVKRTASYIAGSLDPNGYLPLPIEFIQAAVRQPESVVQEALHVLQTLEPAGVGARTVKECLLLQLDRDSASDAPRGTAEAVKIGLELIARRDLTHLAQRLHIEPAHAEAIVRYIRDRLNPRPGLAHQPLDRTAYVEPDATIRLTGAGLEITLHDRHLPQLALNVSFEGAQRKHAPHEEDFAAYIADRSRAARALLAGLEQRRATLLRVIAALADAQLDFVQHGPIALKPLQLRDVAAKIGLHPSTVSRAIRHKQVRTPAGLFALKQFFAPSLPAAADAESAQWSARQAMEHIRRWIAAEDKRKPYSDRELAERLAQDGIAVSRRTVTKYRESLRLPASPLRRCRS